MKQKLSFKLLCAFLAAVVVLATMPSAVFATENTSELSFAVVSDTHYYDQSLYHSDVDSFVSACKKTISTSYLADSVLDSAFAALKAHADDNNLKYLLIPGDLTKNGELASHLGFAERLAAFEEETGIQVFVINGNHDINNSNAASYVNGGFVPASSVTPENFKTIYSDFGYDLADSFYTPPQGEKGGMLSYAATLDGGYRLIAVDDGCYSADNIEKTGATYETRGNVTDSLRTWVLNEIRKAKAEGLTVIGMSHHNVVPHFSTEESLFQDFPVDCWQTLAESYADAGMNYTFSGHIHMQDVSSWVSDSGETIYDVATTSVLSFPNYFREVTMSTDENGKVEMDVETFDVDCEKPVVYGSYEYPVPFRNVSFGLNFVGNDPSNMVMQFADYYLNDVYIPQIKAAGGLYNFLISKIDLKSTFDDLLNGGVKFVGITVFSSENLLSLVKEMCARADKVYIEHPERLMELARTEINKLLNIEISDYPCTKYIDTLGFGSSTRNGTLGDAVASCLAYVYNADEDSAGDLFMQDIIAKFDAGENSQKIFDTLLEVALDDLVKEEIFKNFELRLSYAFPEGTFGARLVRMIDAILFPFFGGNFTLSNIVDRVFKLISDLGIIEYRSIDDIIHHYIDEYLTESQMDTIAAEFARFFRCFTQDSDPWQKADKNVTLVYDGPVEVTPTVDDLRLPSNISVTFGDSAATSRNISWYTKLSLTATDIEIVPYSAAPVFSGVPSSGAGISTSTVTTVRTLPGVDFGVFGVLNYDFKLNRHIVSLTGLTPGAKYCYRVGDASRGWWSKVGVIETADNSDSLTFLHTSDCQSGIERQYEVWADTLDTAFSMLPDTDFIVNTGDLSDSGNNFRQWNWMFNTASDTLQSTVLMPAAGNHEAKGEYALDKNFILPNVPQQNTESGVYYSFDYNNAHFIVLNTNNLNADEGLSDDQMAWLKADAAASNAQWKIVALHKAPYSNGSHYDDDDVIQIRKQLQALMPQLGIDVVLQGHDHVYLRTNAMTNNRVDRRITEVSVTNDGKAYTAKVNPNGTIYVISACSGVKYYQTKSASDTDKLFPRAEKIVDATYPVFSAFTIKGNMLYFDAYGVKDGTASRIDSFAIQK